VYGAWNHANLVDVLIEHGAATQHHSRPAVLEPLGQVTVGVVVAVHVTCRCVVCEAVVVVRVEELREVGLAIALLSAESTSHELNSSTYLAVSHLSLSFSPGLPPRSTVLGHCQLN